MKVAVNQELVDKLNQILQITPEPNKEYFLVIGGYVFLCGEIRPSLKFELEDGVLLFYDDGVLIGDLTLKDTVEVDFIVTETTETNKTETYFGE